MFDDHATLVLVDVVVADVDVDADEPIVVLVLLTFLYQIVVRVLVKEIMEEGFVCLQKFFLMSF